MPRDTVAGSEPSLRSKELAEIAVLRKCLDEIRVARAETRRPQPKYRFVNPYFTDTTASWQVGSGEA